MESRLTELETKLSFAEDQIEALNRTVYHLQAQVDGLQEQLRLLYRQMRTANDSEADDAVDNPRDEIPPHY
jgi:SlyX protein